MQIIISTLILTTLCFGHFQTIIPSNDNEINNQTTISMKFMHPFEGHQMNMPKPSNIGVVANGTKQSLNNILTQDGTGWKFNYTFKEPDNYYFFVEPSAYFEKSENKNIIHYAKVCVNFGNASEDWEKPIGLPVEIVPSIKPFGLYAGNSFGGQVLHKGKPAKKTKIEIEYANTKNLKAPSDAHITQEIYTDDRGYFSFTMPIEGWWGFNAIINEGRNELGGTIWVKAYRMK